MVLEVVVITQAGRNGDEAEPIKNHSTSILKNDDQTHSSPTAEHYSSTDIHDRAVTSSTITLHRRTSTSH